MKKENKDIVLDENDIDLRKKVKYNLDSLNQFEEKKTENEDSDRQKTLQILLDTKDINLKTELNDREILEISKLQVVSQRINSVSLALFLSGFKELRVSKNRQGRKEIVGAIQDDDTKKNNNFFDQFITDMIGKKSQ